MGFFDSLKETLQNTQEKYDRASERYERLNDEQLKKKMTNSSSFAEKKAAYDKLRERGYGSKD